MEPEKCRKCSIAGVLFALLIASSAAAQDTRWFVVSEIEPQRNQSYLLPLSNPAAIGQARTLIEQGPDGEVGSIANVTIAAGPDGFNRDVLAAGEPLWSWHVVAFNGFSDFAIELCDGWPGLIELDVRAFIRNTEAQVCFWGYTVTAELDTAPEFRINSSLSGGWYNPDTPGQGLMLEVLPESAEIFAAWFTYAEAAAKIGAPEHRWLTAQGNFLESNADLDLTLTTGGMFDDSAPVDNAPAGTLRLTFEDCNHAAAEYAIGDGPTGVFTLRRLVPDDGCEPPTRR